MSPRALSTRDAQLPAAYSDRLEALSLAPLWTALHALLPPERQTRVVPHRWRWSELRAPLLEAARLVPIEQAERRVLVLCNPGLPGNFSATATLYAGLATDAGLERLRSACCARAVRSRPSSSPPATA